MKRIRGFQFVVLQEGQWNAGSNPGQWRLSSKLLASAVGVENSWHRTWNQCLAAYRDSCALGESKEAIITSANDRVVLAVIGKKALANEFTDSDGEPLWKSSEMARSPSEEQAGSSDDRVFVNFNCNAIAWVDLVGAEMAVPCSLSFLERRAKKNPDGIYGRMVARLGELRDYFGSDRVK